MPLRNYQVYASNKGFEAILKPECRSIIAAPTGVGKSWIIADLVKRLMTTWPAYPMRVLSLVHVKELIEQNTEKLKLHFPEAVVGIYSSGLKKKELHYPITFAGIASIYKQAAKIGKIDVVIVDECHLIGTKDSSMYVSFIRALTTINPNLKLIGLTATPYRQGLGMLTDGELFNDICCDMTTLEAFNWFFDEGYLARLTPIEPSIVFDDTGIKTTAGDYNVHDMDKKLNVKSKNEIVVDEIIRFGTLENRKSWLIFGVSIDHVMALYDIFTAKGISTTYVHSKMTDEERDKNIADYKAGLYQCMINNGILTTGFDYPGLDLIGVVRLIKSSNLWVQILGRGTRPDYIDGYDLDTKEGRLAAIANSAKPDCLVMDFGGNTERLGPINEVILPKKKGSKGGRAPTMKCACGALLHISATVCPRCGTEFLRDMTAKFNEQASDKELIAKKRKEVVPPPPPITVKVNVDSVVHVFKKGLGGKPDSIQAHYNCGLSRFTAYLNFDHPKGTYPWIKARKWWRDHVANTPYAESEPPSSVAEALSRTNELREPQSIEVVVNSKWQEIQSYDFVNKVDLKSA